jgi:hypothetical protein
MSDDIASLVARLKLSEQDQLEFKTALDQEQISALQILTGVVTVDELEEIGVKAVVLEAIRREIHDFQERKRIEEQIQVILENNANN